MTVKELKQKLSSFPDHMEIFISERKTEFKYGLLNSVYTKEINFIEDIGDEPLAKGKVVVLDEE